VDLQFEHKLDRKDHGAWWKGQVRVCMVFLQGGEFSIDCTLPLLSLRSPHGLLVGLGLYGECHSRVHLGLSVVDRTLAPGQPICPFSGSIVGSPVGIRGRDERGLIGW
jgi:hypothetical protein